MEWQLRNWLYFHWLSGDHIVEQHDPQHRQDDVGDEGRAPGQGHRHRRAHRSARSPEYGNVYDHFNSVIEWKNGVRVLPVEPPVGQRRHRRLRLGVRHEGRRRHAGTARSPARTSVQRPEAGMEHVRRPSTSCCSSRSATATPINNGDYMAKSTLVSIMVRMSAYTGKTVYWDQRRRRRRPRPEGRRRSCWSRPKTSPRPSTSSARCPSPRSRCRGRRSSSDFRAFGVGSRKQNMQHAMQNR